MAGRKLAGIGKDVQPGPVARIVASPGQVVGKRVAGAGKLPGRPPDRLPPHQGRGGLAKGTGTNLLSDLAHPAFVVGDDVDNHPATADRRASLDARLGRFEPLVVGDRGGEPQYVPTVEIAGHDTDIGSSLERR